MPGSGRLWPGSRRSGRGPRSRSARPDRGGSCAPSAVAVVPQAHTSETSCRPRRWPSELPSGRRGCGAALARARRARKHRIGPSPEAHPSNAGGALRCRPSRKRQPRPRRPSEARRARRTAPMPPCRPCSGAGRSGSAACRGRGGGPQAPAAVAWLLPAPHGLPDVDGTTSTRSRMANNPLHGRRTQRRLADPRAAAPAATPSTARRTCLAHGEHLAARNGILCHAADRRQDRAGRPRSPLRGSLARARPSGHPVGLNARRPRD